MMLTQGYHEDIIRILYGYGWEGHPVAIGGKSIPFAIWWKGSRLALVERAPHCHLVGRASHWHISFYKYYKDSLRLSMKVS